MSDSLGAVAYDDRNDPGYMGMGGHHDKKYSEETAKSIDIEVRKILDDAHELAKKIINENREKLELMMQMLIEFETLDAEDIRRIMSGEWTADEKRGRLKTAADLHKKAPVAPPPSPFEPPTPMTSSAAPAA